MEEKKKGKKSNLVTRISVEVVIIFILFFLLGILNKNFMFFSDTIHFSLQYPSNSQIISPLTPITDTTIIGERNGLSYKIDNQIIDKTISKFSIGLPDGLNKQQFDQVEVKIDFAVEKTEEILLGIKNPNTDDIIYAPIYSKFFNGLDWPKITDGDLTVFQKEEDYDSIESFLADPPLPTEETYVSKGTTRTRLVVPIADYYFDYNPGEIILDQLPDSVPAATSTSTPFLEEGYLLYTLLTEPGDLNIDVEKRDINYYGGEDIMPVSVYDSKDNTIYFTEIADDGIEGGSQETSDPQLLNISVEGLKAGLYKIVTGIGDVHSKVTVNQPYLVAANQVMTQHNRYQADNPFKLFTDAYAVNIPVWHIDGTSQKLTINDQTEIELTDSRVNQPPLGIILGTSNSVNSIQLGKNHVFIKNSDPITRYFSFTAESFFNPDPLRAQVFQKDELENYSYFITNYREPSLQDGFYTSSHTFNLNNLGIENQIDFSIYSPNLTTLSGEIKIKSIDIYLKP
ncbi:MAG: hypothetical protein ABIB97_00830 [Patescibacteria group bacterium]